MGLGAKAAGVQELNVVLLRERRAPRRPRCSAADARAAPHRAQGKTNQVSRKKEADGGYSLTYNTALELCVPQQYH